ncbi:type IV pilin protein [Desulfonatronovibrio magnus]|uniref:type IV pilin protein n=1 Tax=Desulfonatronovibrio magnus TaxID=698827 RepID=UPI0006986AB0|nr:prepilin-type N-terminal cleavage/methylation domain-containing protein [Desulfonatronovibrio magnus]
MERRIQGGQGGFTLIELIAVIVILGILAVVAIPRYVDLQESARVAAADGACAAVNSSVSLGFAEALIGGEDTSTAAGTACAEGIATSISGDWAFSTFTACTDTGNGSVEISRSDWDGDYECTIFSPTPSP